MMQPVKPYRCPECRGAGQKWRDTGVSECQGHWLACHRCGGERFDARTHRGTGVVWLTDEEAAQAATATEVAGANP